MVLIVKDPLEVNWGRKLVTSDKSIFNIFLIMTMQCWKDDEADNYGILDYTSGIDTEGEIITICENANKHTFTKLLHLAKYCMDVIDDKSWDEDDCVQYAISKLGHYIRRVADGSDVVDLVDVGLLPADFSSVAKGAGANTFDCLMSVLHYVGSDLVHLFGEWSKVEPKFQDDMIAGMFAILFYISTWDSVEDYSLGDIFNKAITYGDPNGLGVRKQFNENDFSTLFSLFFEGENGTTPILGLDDSYINDKNIRDTQLYIMAGAEDIANRLLTSSKWVYRFGHSIYVKPLFTITLETDNINNTLTDAVANLDEFYCFYNYTNDKKATWKKELRILISRVVSRYWKRQVFGKMKESWTKKRVIDLKINDGEKTTGGITIISNMRYTSEDNKIFWFWNADNKQWVLDVKKDNTHDYWFEVLDDVKIRDIRFLFGNSYDRIGADPLVVGPTGDYPICRLGVKDGFVLYTSKNESREYIARQDPDPLKTLLAAQKDTGILRYLSQTDLSATFNDDVTPSPYACTVTTKTKTFYNYDRRTLDPFKKLKHSIHDINNFDAEAIFSELLSSIIPGAGKINEVIESNPGSLSKKDEATTNIVEVSAVIQSDDSKKIDEKVEKEITDEIPTSATPDFTDKAGKKWWKRKGESQADFDKRHG